MSKRGKDSGTKVKADAYTAPYFGQHGPMDVYTDHYREDPSIHSTDMEVPLKGPAPVDGPRHPERPEDAPTGGAGHNAVLTAPIPLVISAPDAIEKMKGLNDMVEEARPDLKRETQEAAKALEALERKANGEEAAEGADKVPASGEGPEDGTQAQYAEGDHVTLAMSDGKYNGEIQKINEDGTYDVATDKHVTFTDIPASSLARREDLFRPASGAAMPKGTSKTKAVKGTKAEGDPVTAPEPATPAAVPEVTASKEPEADALLLKAEAEDLMVLASAAAKAGDTDGFQKLVAELDDVRALQGDAEAIGRKEAREGVKFQANPEARRELAKSVQHRRELRRKDEPRKSKGDPAAEALEEPLPEGEGNEFRHLPEVRVDAGKKAKKAVKASVASGEAEMQLGGVASAPAMPETAPVSNAGGELEMGGGSAGLEVQAAAEGASGPEGEDAAKAQAEAARRAEAKGWSETVSPSADGPIQASGADAAFRAIFGKWLKGQGISDPEQWMLKEESKPVYAAYVEQCLHELNERGELPPELKERFSAAEAPLPPEAEKAGRASIQMQRGSDIAERASHAIEEGKPAKDLLENAAGRAEEGAQVARETAGKIKATAGAEGQLHGAPSHELIASGKALELAASDAVYAAALKALPDLKPESLAFLYADAKGNVFASAKPFAVKAKVTGAAGDGKVSAQYVVDGQPFEQLSEAKDYARVESAMYSGPKVVQSSDGDVLAKYEHGKATMEAKIQASASPLQASVFDTLGNEKDGKPFELELGGGLIARRKANKKAEVAEKETAGAVKEAKADHKIEIVDAEGKVVETFPDAFGDDAAMVVKLLRKVMDIKDEPKAKEGGEAKGEGGDEGKGAEKPKGKPEASKEGVAPQKPEAGKEGAPPPRALPNVRPPKTEASLKAEALLLRARAEWAEQRIEKCREIVKARLAKGFLQTQQSEVDALLLKGLSLTAAQAEAARKTIDRETMGLLAMDDAELDLTKASLDGQAPLKVKAASVNGGLERLVNIRSSSLIWDKPSGSGSLGVALSLPY